MKKNFFWQKFLAVWPSKNEPFFWQKWEIWHNFQYQANGNPKWQKKIFFRKSYNMSLLGISMIMMIHLVIKIFIFLFRWSGSSIFSVWKIKGSEKAPKMVKNHRVVEKGVQKRFRSTLHMLSISDNVFGT